MAKQMVRPTQAAVSVTVNENERIGFINIRTEIDPETHERMKLECIRRRRQGLPSTMDAVLKELIEKARDTWPSPIAD